MDLLHLFVLVSAFIASAAYFEWRFRRAKARIVPELTSSLQNAFLEEYEVESEKGMKMRLLRPDERGKRFIGALAPAFVQSALGAIKLKLPAGGTLPINPATGQLDFMAPVLGKIAAGKKVGFEDFLPFIMEKAMPYVENFMSNLPLGQKSGQTPLKGGKPATTENPFMKELNR